MARQKMQKNAGDRLVGKDSGRGPVVVIAPLILGAAVAVGALDASPAPAAQPEPALPVSDRAAARIEISQSAAPIAFDIPAQPLAQALIALGQQAGLQVTFDPAQLSGLRSRSVTGRYSATVALRLLLQGTGMVHRFTDDHTVTLARVEGQAEGTMVLDQINVESKAETATGPVDGYVATRSASATKTDTPIIETPRAISVVTADQVADRKAQNVEEALRYTSGVLVSSNGHDPRFDQIIVRGFSVTSDADFRDGLRQSNSGWLSYFRTESYGLERIEVVKGPNSVLFGQISPGGMVNRVTKRPTAEAKREVEVQAGSQDHYQGQFDLAGPLAEAADWQYRIVGLARDSESDLVGVNDDNLYFAPALTWQPNDRTRVTLLAQLQDSETAGSARPYQYASGELSHFWAGDEDFDGLLQKQAVGGYELAHRFNDTFTLRQNLRYGYVDTENQYLLSGTLTGDTLSRTAYGLYEEMTNFTVDTSLESKFSTGPVDHKLIAGVDYLKLDAEVDYLFGAAPSISMSDPDYHQAIADPATPLARQTIDGQQLGLYAQDQVSWGNWRLTFGLRHDQVDREVENRLTTAVTEQEDGATTGSVGLLYLFDMGLAPYASYATSFVPQFGSNLFGDPYEPTEGEQIEVGLKYQPPGADSFFTASLFDLVQRNVLTTDPGNPGNQIQTGERRSRGVELEATMSLAAGLDLVANYTYQDVEVTESNDGNEGKRPAGIPEHLASAWAHYAVPDGGLKGVELGVGGRWVGDSYDDALNTKENDGYAIFDARLAYRLDDVLPGMTLAVNATNLGDKRYITCQSGYCYRGRGRTVIGSINYHW